jgi:hypothetical protein
MNDDMATRESVHHETSDINIRAVFAFGAGLLVSGIVIYLMVWLLFLYFASRGTAGTTVQFPLGRAVPNRLPPEPRLQTNPRQDLRALRSAEDQVLNSYGWVDRNIGTVRIPVDQAMKLVVERGLPARQEGNK